MNEREKIEDTRWLWKDEQRAGPFTVQQLYRMLMHGDITNHTLFWIVQSDDLTFAQLMPKIFHGWTKERIKK